MMHRILTLTQVAEEVLDPDLRSYSAQSLLLAGWAQRGRGIAVYENLDLGHPAVGHKVAVTYGSADAQIETEEPPSQLPDGLLKETTGGINWRYQLLGVRPPSEPGLPVD